MDEYSKYCKEYKEYWEWVEKRNDNRYNNNMEHGKNYDSKNMMHTIRLLQVAEEIFREGKINVKRKNRYQLLSIKSGKMDHADLLNMADEIFQRIEIYAKTSSLQEKPNMEVVENIIVNMRNTLY